MKIYKISKNDSTGIVLLGASIVEKTDDIDHPYDTYLSLGHPNFVDGNADGIYLWVLKDGKLNVAELEYPGQSHSSFWTGFGDTYAGRFDSNKNVVSVTSCHFPPRNIPSALVRMLKEKFGSDITIYNFSYADKWIKTSMNLKTVLDSDEMLDFILSNNLKDWSGQLDYNEAKEIARHSNRWELKEVDLSNFDWVADPDVKSDVPPIIFLDDGEYEVLDGVHRIGAAKARGDSTIMAYVGEWE